MASESTLQQLQERINQLEENLAYANNVHNTLMNNTEEFAFFLINAKGTVVIYRLFIPVQVQLILSQTHKIAVPDAVFCGK